MTHPSISIAPPPPLYFMTSFPSQFANIVFLTYQTFVTNLHQLRVELHRVTGP